MPPPTQPGPAVPPGGYYQPPVAPPPGPPTGSRMGRGKTIGIIVGAVVAVGALGGVGWAVFGGKDKTPAAVTPATPGGGVLNPTPTTTGGPTTSPTTPTTTVPPTTTPPSGGTVQVGTLSIPLVGTWSVQGQSDDGTAAFLSDGLSEFLYLEQGSADPTTDGASAAANVAQSALSADNGYSQVQVSDPIPHDPGPLNTLGEVDYSGVWSDAQGSFEVEGFIAVGIRADGTALIVWLEGSPPGTLTANQGSWQPMINNALNTLAGL